MGKGKASDHSKGTRGHSWKGRGAERRCSRCGDPPKGRTEGALGPVNMELTEMEDKKIVKLVLYKVNRLTGEQKKRRDAAREKNAKASRY